MTVRTQDRSTNKMCKWCGLPFKTKSFRHRFCSDGCSSAFHNHREGRYTCGPCPTCGNKFLSKTKGKKYCALKCYTQSEQFAAIKAANLLKINPQGPRVCKGCGEEYPRSRRAKYCSQRCRREYFAKRFDRWIANPESIALPQNYDEFLSRNTLPCPVDGCEWEGEFLGAHVNHCHGISAREFKILCGFNVTTGLVGQALSKHMADKARGFLEDGTWVAIVPGQFEGETPRVPASLEGREHAVKARADVPKLRDTYLPCRECGTDVQQPGYGRRWYCSVKCRSLSQAKRGMSSVRCSHCGAEFNGSRDQVLRSQRDLPVCCSITCRNQMNAAASLQTTEHSTR